MLHLVECGVSSQQEGKELIKYRDEPVEQTALQLCTGDYSPRSSRNNLQPISGRTNNVLDTVFTSTFDKKEKNKCDFYPRLQQLNNTVGTHMYSPISINSNKDFISETLS